MREVMQHIVIVVSHNLNMRKKNMTLQFILPTWRKMLMIKLVKLVQAKTNPNLSYKLLITMYDRRNKICNIIKDRMHQKMGHWLYDTIIEVDTKLRECPAFGQPITTYAPQTRGAQQYRALAREVSRK